MHKRVCFQSNQEGQPTPNHSPFKDFWIKFDPQSDTCWWGKPVCKTGDCYANDHLLFFVFICYPGTHDLLDILRSGGSKELYLLLLCKHWYTHLYATHGLHQRTWTWLLTAEKAMTIINIYPSCVLAEMGANLGWRKCILKWAYFRGERNLCDCAWMHHQKFDLYCKLCVIVIHKHNN